MPILLVALMFICCSGCSHEVFSSSTLSLVDVSFLAVKERPEAYLGQHVLAGGVIAGIGNSAAGGELEVLETPLDSAGRPKAADRSARKFVILSKDFLDPLIYQKGLMVSLVGEVLGKRSRPLDSLPYDYPLLGLRELHLWQPEDVSQPFPFVTGLFHPF